MSPPLKSWLQIDPKSHFSIHNIPFGIISTSTTPHARAAVAIGSYALDLHAFAQGNGFSKLSIIQPNQACFSHQTLNAFAALGRPIHKIVREYLQSVFLEDGPFPEVLQVNETLRKQALFPLKEVKTHLPMHIGDYTVGSQGAPRVDRSPILTSM
jgi:fumarylacetoacetase